MLKGTGATYAIGNALAHMKTNNHQKKVQEDNAIRVANGQDPLPAFVEKTQEQLTGQVRISADATCLCSLLFPASLYGDVLAN